MTRARHGHGHHIRMQGRPAGLHTVYGVFPVPPLREPAWPASVNAPVEETVFEWPPIDIDGRDTDRRPSPESLATLVRRLTPHQGVMIMVRLGDASALLLPQLGSPERVGPSHRVPCRADVYSTPGGLAWEDAVAAIAAEAETEAPLSPLTPVLAGRLGLARYLRSSAPVVALSVVEDPTGDSRLVAERPVRQVSHSTGTLPGRQPNHSNETLSGRTRDAAISSARQARRRRRSLWGRLRGFFARGRVKRERSAWFAAVSNHPLPVQLWEISPTADLILDGAVRRWVRESAALLGMPGEQLVREWEIHWRRRGL